MRTRSGRRIIHSDSDSSDIEENSKTTATTAIFSGGRIIVTPKKNQPLDSKMGPPNDSSFEKIIVEKIMVMSDAMMDTIAKDMRNSHFSGTLMLSQHFTDDYWDNTNPVVLEAIQATKRRLRGLGHMAQVRAMRDNKNAVEWRINVNMLTSLITAETLKYMAISTFVLVGFLSFASSIMAKNTQKSSNNNM